MAKLPSLNDLRRADELVRQHGSGGLQREFAWSFSRSQLFKTDLQKYWEQYYGSWGGWLREAPKSVRALYQAKQTTNVPAWIGSQTHVQIARTLKILESGQTPNYKQQAAKLATRMEGQWAGYEAVENFTGNKKLLQLDIFNGGNQIPSKARLIKAQGEAIQAYRAFSKTKIAKLANLATNEEFQNRIALKKIISEKQIAEWDMEFKNIDKIVSWDFEGTKVWGAPDLALQTTTQAGRTKLYIADWKWKMNELSLKNASKAEQKVLMEQYKRQLQTYAVWAQKEYGVEAKDIRLVSAVLHRGKPKVKMWRVTEQELEETRQYMRQSISSMKEVLEDQDVERNFMHPPHIKPEPRAIPSSATTGSAARAEARVAESSVAKSIIKDLFSSTKAKVGAGLIGGFIGLGLYLHHKARHNDTSSQRQSNTRYMNTGIYNIGYAPASRMSYGGAMA